MLLFLLVFNLIEISALNTKCKRFYDRTENSALAGLAAFYTFIPWLPDFSGWHKKEGDHVDQFTCGNFCVNVSFARIFK